MKSYLDALRFILNSRKQRFDNINCIPITFDINGGTLGAYRFERVAKNGGSRPKGTVLAVGGMSVYGLEDRRFHNCCRAMADCGFRVLFVSYPDIDNFRIRAETVRDIAATVRALTKDQELCPDGKLSLFAPSFSGGMALLAASHPDMADLVGAVCTVGTFGNVESSIKFLLERQDNDDYGRMIILHNFIRYSLEGLVPRAGKRFKRLEEALKVSFMDNGYHRENPELPSYLEGLSLLERDIFVRLKNDPSYRMYHWKRILENAGDLRVIMEDLCVFSRVDAIKMPVALIHGRRDDVIPPSESVLLHDRLKKLGRKTRLVLTPLISHGDSKFSPAMFIQTLHLASGFAFFFKHAMGRGMRVRGANVTPVHASSPS